MYRQNSKYAIRKYHIAIGFTLVIIIFIARLYMVQMIDPEYKLLADNNAFLRKTLYPSRGMIYDCNNKLIVYNRATSNVMVITRQLAAFDTLDLCNTLNIDKEYINTRLEWIKDRKLNRGYSPYLPQLFLSEVTPEETGLLEEKLFKFPGFYIEHRTARDYNTGVGGQIIGMVGEVNQDDINRDNYYTPGDYSGRTGIERSYENHLRGEKGVAIMLRDAHGRIQGSYEGGKYDRPLISGHDLKMSIDIDLQAYGEQLMHGKKGAIVMIEPKTGEIRCLVSSPSFDLRKLSGRERAPYLKELEQNQQKPLYNRAIMGTYPPGSTFKPAQAAVFLKEDIITPHTIFPCHHGYTLLRGKPGCHGHPSPLPLVPALATSCNSYFCWGLHLMLDNRAKYKNIEEAFEVWKNDIVNLGFGYPLGIDMPGERRGYIPNSNVYDKFFNGRWTSSSIISIAIGQGEILATPLQIANFAAIVANRGYYYTPHIVKEIVGEPADSLHIQKMQTGMSSSIFDVIDEGMAAAVKSGTCRSANLDSITVCGKTGTAENPQGKDHSIFMGYAPRKTPKISICVYVENAGFGATFAVPIGRLMMEYYLRGHVSSPLSKALEEKMINSTITY